MKKTKKLAALVLAMVMAFSLMAVTAAAYGADEHVHDGTCCEETIQPRKPGAAVCPYCGQVMTDIRSGHDDRGSFNEYRCDYPDCKQKGYTTKIYWPY